MREVFRVVAGRTTLLTFLVCIFLFVGLPLASLMSKAGNVSLGIPWEFRTSVTDMEETTGRPFYRHTLHLDALLLDLAVYYAIGVGAGALRVWHQRVAG
jgi:hypothetical protein